MKNKFNLEEQEIQILKTFKDEKIAWGGISDECEIDVSETGNIFDIYNEKLKKFIMDYPSDDVKLSIKEVLKELDLFREVSEIKNLTGLKNGYGLEIESAKIDSSEIITASIIRSGDKLKCTVADFLGVEKHFEKFLKSLGFLFEIKSEEAKN
ncbi:MAG: hypothetical protein ACRC0V_00360 [Fusobacteriaceae bacterium]